MEQEEGGWSWLVVLASFLCVMVLDGIGYSYGGIFLHILTFLIVVLFHLVFF